jgi:hypothetical protein
VNIGAQLVAAGLQFCAFALVNQRAIQVAQAAQDLDPP